MAGYVGTLFIYTEKDLSVICENQKAEPQWNVLEIVFDVKEENPTSDIMGRQLLDTYHGHV